MLASGTVHATLAAASVAPVAPVAPVAATAAARVTAKACEAAAPHGDQTHAATRAASATRPKPRPSTVSAPPPAAGPKAGRSVEAASSSPQLPERGGETAREGGELLRALWSSVACARDGPCSFAVSWPTSGDAVVVVVGATMVMRSVEASCHAPV